MIRWSRAITIASHDWTVAVEDGEHVILESFDPVRMTIDEAEALASALIAGVLIAYGRREKGEAR